MKKIILLFLIFSSIISGYRVTSIFIEYKQAENYYNNIQEEYIQEVEPVNIATCAPIMPHTTTLHCPIEVDFKKLKKINKDVIGWIYSENTEINYPVMHTSNNVYYLRHLLDKQYSASGSIFLDAMNDSQFKDDNSILYGHHMKNGSMFAAIEKYKEQEYYNKHKTLWLLTPTKNYLIAPFGGLVVSPSRKNYFITTFNDNNQQQKYINRIIKNSAFVSDTIPNIADQLITLATCDYSFENARFILVGILMPSID